MPPNLILDFFAKFIESELGIVYSEHNYFQLQNRLDDICNLLGFENTAALHESAKTGISGQFKQLLLDVATNNETLFFRDPKMFKTVENFVLPALQELNPSYKKLMIWSAACSTGQEPLSIAMMLNEYNLKTGKELQYSITATDISNRVLLRAQSGQYSQLEVQRGLPMPLMLKYFTKDEKDCWTANGDLRSQITYKSLNLKDELPLAGTFDIIFCRNVLIYQSIERKKEILKKITSKLNDGGFLILGAGETLVGLSSDFEPTATQDALLYKKLSPLTKAA